VSAHTANVARFDASGHVADDRLVALFDAHRDRLYVLARRLTATPDDARDLVQDTFARAARSLPRVPAGHAHEEAWLVRVLVNLRRDAWRKTSVRRRFAATVNAVAASGPNPESIAIVRRVVWDALDTLPPRRRATVIMHELEGLSLRSIAEVLGVTEMTVRWNLSMARRELKRVLAPHVGGLR
jgi:RNA polymerase sigma-70 factor (ECF subfamily)